MPSCSRRLLLLVLLGIGAFEVDYTFFTRGTTLFGAGFGGDGAASIGADEETLGVERA